MRGEGRVIGGRAIHGRVAGQRLARVACRAQASVATCCSLGRASRSPNHFVASGRQTPAKLLHPGGGDARLELWYPSLRFFESGFGPRSEPLDGVCVSDPVPANGAGRVRGRKRTADSRRLRHRGPQARDGRRHRNRPETGHCLAGRPAGIPREGIPCAPGPRHGCR